MAKPGREATKRRGRAIKEKMVLEMVGVLEKGHGFVLCNNKGLTLAQATEFRRQAREQGIKVKVLKNTLLRRSLEQVGIDTSDWNGMLTRETMILVGLEDAVSPAKLAVNYAKDHEKLEFKGGYIDGQLIDSNGVEALSKLPGREELLQKLLGSFQAPVQNMVYLANAIVAKPVHLADAIRRKKEEAA